MKSLFRLSALLMLLCFMGCSDDEGISYPTSDAPEIKVLRDELYSNPNRKFVIKADLKDDLGLKSLKIVIPEFYLDKEIVFPTDTLVTEYELAYEFLAPKDTKNEDVYKVNLALEDVSGNVVTKELTLHLDGDFNAPNFSNVSPQDGTVQLLESKMKLSLSFKVTDDSGLDSVYVEEPILGIMERIKLNGEKEYSFNKTYSLPSKPEEYELKITAIDNFVEANRKTQKIKYIVSSEMVTLFLADVPKRTDLTADVCGVPMLYHKKSNGIFTFKYYADCDNKEIYFLGQESAFEPHCFGVSEENGKLLNSPSAAPIVLPTKGYYEIVANTKEQTYTVTPYIPSSAVHDSPDITMCGYGFEGAGWDPSNKNCLLTPDAENPYILGRTLILNETQLNVTITYPGWSKYWRLLENGIIDYMGSSQPYLKVNQKGSYKFIIDTEIARAKLLKE